MSEARPAFPVVARLFLGFGVMACLVVVLGLVLALYEGAALAPFAWPSLNELLRGLSRLSSEGVLGLGLLLLLSLPLVRNAAVVVSMWRRGERRAALLALFVLLALTLLYSFLSA